MSRGLGLILISALALEACAPSPPNRAPASGPVDPKCIQSAVKRALQSNELDDLPSQSATLFKEIASECADETCFKSRLAAAAPRLHALIDKTCISKNPVAARELVKKLTFAWATYGIYHFSKDMPKTGDFPWEYVATGLIWTTAFTEIGCRNTFGKEAAAQPQGFTAFLKDSSKRAMAYAKWMPFASATTVSFEMAADELRGHDKPLSDYAFKLGFYMTYDLGFGIAKQVFLLDPIYLRAFPHMAKTIDHLVKTKAMAKIVQIGAENSARFAIVTADSMVFFKANDHVNAFLSRELPVIQHSEIRPEMIIRELNAQDAKIKSGAQH